MGKLKLGLILTLFLAGIYFLNDSRNPSGAIMRLFGSQSEPKMTDMATSTDGVASSSVGHVILPVPVNNPNVGVVATSTGRLFVQTESLIPSSIAQLTNVQRLQRGLAPVIMNPALSLSAQKKVRDIFEKQYFEHISPTGVGVSDLARQSGYDYVVVGENLALGSFPTNKSVVDAWMASQGHRANILDSRYQEIGVAIDRGMFQGSLQWVVVQHFGKPVSACVKLDPNVKTKIEADKVYVSSLEVKISRLKSEIDATTGPAYQAKVAEYNTYVKEYNARIIALQTDIINYNKTAADFNACIGTKTIN